MKKIKTNIFLRQTYKKIRVSVFVLNIFIMFQAKEIYAFSFQAESEVSHIILAKFWDFFSFYLLLFFIKIRIKMKN